MLLSIKSPGHTAVRECSSAPWELSCPSSSLWAAWLLFINHPLQIRYETSTKVTSRVTWTVSWVTYVALGWRSVGTWVKKRFSPLSCQWRARTGGGVGRSCRSTTVYGSFIDNEVLVLWTWDPFEGLRVALEKMGSIWPSMAKGSLPVQNRLSRLVWWALNWDMQDEERITKTRWGSGRPG